MDAKREKQAYEDQITTKTKHGLSKRAKIFFFLIFVLFCVLGYVNSRKLVKQLGVDFCNYYIAAFAAEELSIQNIYDSQNAINATAALLLKARKTRDQELAQAVEVWILGLQRTPTPYHFNATPFLYSMLSIFRLDSYLLSLWVYRIVSLFCYVFAIWWLCRRIGYSVQLTIGFLLILTSWFKPFQYSMSVANVDLLQLGVLMFFLFLLTKHSLIFANGIFLGLIFAFKPNILFVVLTLSFSWIANRRFKILVLTGFGAVLGIAIAVLSSSDFFGSMRCWLYWPGRLKLFVNDVFSAPINYASARLIWELYGIKISPYLALFFLCVAGIFVWLCRRLSVQAALQDRENAQNAKMNFQEDSLMISIGLLIYLLSGPVVWEHYFIYTIPIMLIAFRSSIRAESPTSHELIMQQILVTLTFLGLSAQNFVSLSNNVTAIFCNSSTLILFALALRELWRLKKHGKETTAAL